MAVLYYYNTKSTKSSFAGDNIINTPATQAQIAAATNLYERIYLIYDSFIKNKRFAPGYLVNFIDAAEAPNVSIVSAGITGRPISSYQIPTLGDLQTLAEMVIHLKYPASYVLDNAAIKNAANVLGLTQ